MEINFENEIWYWRGPSPFHFVTVPPLHAPEIKKLSSTLSYGWGVVPVTVRIGNTEWTTSLIPKDGSYLVPIKNVIRAKEALQLGDRVSLKLNF